MEECDARMRKLFFPVVAMLLCLVGCSSLRLTARKTERIMGMDSITCSQMERFLLRNNPNVPHSYAHKLIATYEQECRHEGVRTSVAFVQMCLETGFLVFPPPSIVRPEQNNFCGLGVISNASYGLSFDSMRAGVRAHVQHLKAYATTEATRRKNIDVRRRFVKLGCSPTVMGLSGTWAADPNYGRKLCNLLAVLREEKR